jgi:adenylosuccinate synthase
MDSAVIGLGFGDEGKGLVTDYLCSKFDNPLVIRFSGGHQAGHTVVRNGVRHIFSNFGSGTLSGTSTYWSKFCTVEPVGLMKELQILKDKGINPTLFIDGDCPVTTPYDIVCNQTISLNDGTCGVGFGTTLAREHNHYSLLFRDLFYPSVWTTKLKMIMDYYKNISLRAIQFMDCIPAIVRSSNILLVDGYAPSFQGNIFEGAQGLLLDQNFGFFPHVTPSNTGTKNILKFTNNFNVYLVTRAYQTRHGNGPMTNTDIGHSILYDPRESNITNDYQGQFRRSLLDIDLLLYVLDKDEYIRTTRHTKTLVITCLDHIRNEYRFTRQGNIVYCGSESNFIDRVSTLLNVDKVLISRTPESSKIEEWTK